MLFAEHMQLDCFFEGKFPNTRVYRQPRCSAPDSPWYIDSHLQINSFTYLSITSFTSQVSSPCISRSQIIAQPSTGNLFNCSWSHFSLPKLLINLQQSSSTELWLCLSGIMIVSKKLHSLEWHRTFRTVSILPQINHTCKTFTEKAVGSSPQPVISPLAPQKVANLNYSS